MYVQASRVAMSCQEIYLSAGELWNFIHLEFLNYRDKLEVLDIVQPNT